LKENTQLPSNSNRVLLAFKHGPIILAVNLALESSSKANFFSTILNMFAADNPWRTLDYISAQKQ